MIKPTDPIRARARRIVSLLPEPISRAIRSVKRSVLNWRGASNVFTEIYANNAWDGTESISGPGSSMAATANLRAKLPDLLSELGVRTLLDVPCGDSYWISTCLSESIRYIGGDIVPKLVSGNRNRRGNFGEYHIINLVKDTLPPADLILVRDCLIHLPNAQVLQVLSNIKSSQCRYILMTTYTALVNNIDIEIGGFRPVDLTMAPFNLPPPLLLIEESEGGGKAMGLWLSDVL